MKTLIVIPSRFGSSRFPGKPLAAIQGVPLLQRVWRIACAVKGGHTVAVGTDDERIASAATAFGAHVVMTSQECPNGSARALEVAHCLGESFDTVVNLQGDAPLVPPWVIESVLEQLRVDSSIEIGTPAVQLSRAAYDRMVESKAKGIVSGTTVTFDRRGNALYFSKAVLPFFKKPVQTDPVPVYQHIGLYAYRFEALKKFVGFPPGTFEPVEDLEQLRALENGMPIRVVPVSLEGRTLWPIDNPEDVVRVEEIIKSEGELV